MTSRDLAIMTTLGLPPSTFSIQHSAFSIQLTTARSIARRRSIVGPVLLE
jgi:hypothetical protein